MIFIVLCFSDPVINLNSKSCHQLFLPRPRTISSPNLLFLNGIFTSPHVGNNSTTSQLRSLSHAIPAFLIGRKSAVFVEWGAGWASEPVRRQCLRKIFCPARSWNYFSYHSLCRHVTFLL
jgi:hypothetical protein